MRVLTVALLLIAAAGCAGTQKFSLRPRAHCYSDEMSGPTTLADTPDAAIYGADPLKSTGCGAPPR